MESNNKINNEKQSKINSWIEKKNKKVFFWFLLYSKVYLEFNINDIIAPPPNPKAPDIKEFNPYIL